MAVYSYGLNVLEVVVQFLDELLPPQLLSAQATEQLVCTVELLLAVQDLCSYGPYNYGPK